MPIHLYIDKVIIHNGHFSLAFIKIDNSLEIYLEVNSENDFVFKT